MTGDADNYASGGARATLAQTVRGQTAHVSRSDIVSTQVDTVGSHGQCDICDPTLPPLCSGNRLLVCTADGQEQTLYKVCAEGCIPEGTEGATQTTCREDLANASSN